MIEFDRFRQSPRGLNTPANRLVLRSEIIERASSPHDLLGRLQALLDRPGRAHALMLTELAANSSSLRGSTGPFAEALHELERSLRQRLDDQDLMGIARSHLVVAPGNRPDAPSVTSRPASYGTNSMPFNSATPGRRWGRRWISTFRPDPRG
jgi:hypothetical protein